jgi:hypothetical protein
LFSLTLRRLFGCPAGFLGLTPLCGGGLLGLAGLFCNTPLFGGGLFGPAGLFCLTPLGSGGFFGPAGFLGLTLRSLLSGRFFSLLGSLLGCFFPGYTARFFFRSLAFGRRKFGGVPPGKIPPAIHAGATGQGENQYHTEKSCKPGGVFFHHHLISALP